MGITKSPLLRSYCFFLEVTACCFLHDPWLFVFLMLYESRSCIHLLYWAVQLLTVFQIIFFFLCDFVIHLFILRTFEELIHNHYNRWIYEYRHLLMLKVFEQDVSIFLFLFKDHNFELPFISCMKYLQPVSQKNK